MPADHHAGHTAPTAGTRTEPGGASEGYRLRPRFAWAAPLP
ncbi:hypothetical protein KCH_61670 [Kitasatospora cheerisanensis KCTC 2395]|uniref:Uncharacterized protein n=1 Tax=Kitasatospora cheerisanensis KCTC 2395 TaxID=1348663 RepID=A0A066YKK1_9ACTN|nr:hypothetical protein KCH_61670 [Kitasatospora cheerisanensis KCTC 2395]